MTRTITIDVDLDDFSDDEIAEEARRRGIAHLVNMPKDPKVALSADETAKDVYSALTGNRRGDAMIAMRALVEQFLPPNIAAAYEALQSNRVGDAICELDRFFDPSPAVTVATLPRRAA